MNYIKSNKYFNRRKISRIITREKDRDRMLQGVCDNIIQPQGYCHSWIVVFDDNGKIISSKATGPDNYSKIINERLNKGELPDCAGRSLKQEEIVIINNPSLICQNCPLSGEYSDCGAMSVRLEYDGNIYGIISVSIPPEFIDDADEHILFKEISGDIAYAIHNMELEEKRKNTEDKLRKSEERYRTLQENIPIGIYRSTPDGKFLSVNPAMINILGYSSEEELLGISTIDLYYQTERRQELIRRLEKEGSITDFEVQFYRKDGSIIWVSISLHMIEDLKRNFAHLDGIVIDITDKKQAEFELLESEERYRKLVDSSPDFIALQSEWKIIFINTAGLRHLGLSNQDEIIGKSLKGFIYTDKESDDSMIFKSLNEMDYNSSMGVDIKLKPQNKEPVDFEIIASSVSFSGKNAIQIVGRDISKHKKLEKILIETALSDDLTGIPNRRKLFEHFYLQWKLAARNKQYLSLIMIDIDFFKLYNDNYGHQAGDNCLKKVASELSRSLYRPADMIARYGGEEFIAVLPGTDSIGAEEVAEVMREAISDLNIKHKMSSVSPNLTVSLGVASTMPHKSKELSPEKLISLVDKALYRSKNEGRNRISVET